MIYSRSVATIWSCLICAGNFGLLYQTLRLDESPIHSSLTPCNQTSDFKKQGPTQGLTSSISARFYQRRNIHFTRLPTYVGFPRTNAYKNHSCRECYNRQGLDIADHLLKDFRCISVTRRQLACGPYISGAQGSPNFKGREGSWYFSHLFQTGHTYVQRFTATRLLTVSDVQF
ncbi:hypothetical protein F5Y18DRAFT_192381 [Xylariaceae sp. FL1019]|nr:hypothetical protein F5Y18DRAFT_192381 [Xylariaceae sp. FL1019]